MRYFCLGIGVGTKNTAGEWLEVFYPSPELNPNEQIIAAIRTVFPNLQTTTDLDLSDTQCIQLSKAFNQYGIQNLSNITEKLSKSRSPRVLSFIEQDSALVSTPATYLKLHLLSHRLVKPNTLNLEGLFSSLLMSPGLTKAPLILKNYLINNYYLVLKVVHYLSKVSTNSQK